MKLVKTHTLALAVCLLLMVGLLSMTALAADTGSHVYVGGVELTGSADEPAYATTDASGKVTPSGSEDHYNVKWDGTTLTLNGANITGGYSYVDPYGDPSSAAIYRDGDLAVALLGENTVTGPDSGDELRNGISATGDLTISGSGSVEITANFDAFSSYIGDVTILSGKVTTEGGSSGIATYEGDLTISGGEVTVTVPGDQINTAIDYNYVYGIYVFGNCTISGGKVTTTGHAAHSYVTDTYGLIVLGDDGLTISGGELTATATGEYGYMIGMDAFYGILITGGTVTASGVSAGISTRSSETGDIIIEGGTVTATAAATEENCYAIYSRTNVIIGDGTVTAAAAVDGGYGVFVRYGDITISGGKVTAIGEVAGLRSRDGGVTVAPQEGRQIVMTAGADQDSAAAVDGSPFGAETSVTGILQDMKYVRSVSRTDGLPFNDVAADSWYYDGVDYVYAAGLMSGTDDSTFSPDMAASRATVTSSLWHKAGSPVVNFLMDFTDVDTGAWYGEAIRWAASEGIAGGYGGRQFGPDDPVTWEQLAVMLWRYADSPDAAADMSGYSDATSISDWARQAMAWCVEQGIIGDGTTLSPQSEVTRAQVAVTLQKFCQLEW